MAFVQPAHFFHRSLHIRPGPHVGPPKNIWQSPVQNCFTGWMPFLLPNQHCQSTEGERCHSIMTPTKLLIENWKQKKKQIQLYDCYFNS